MGIVGLADGMGMWECGNVGMWECGDEERGMRGWGEDGDMGGIGWNGSRA